MKTGDKVNPNLDKQNQYLKFARLNKESTDDELKDAKKILEQLKIEIPQEEK
jgi:ribosome recycling factor